MLLRGNISVVKGWGGAEEGSPFSLQGPEFQKSGQQCQMEKESQAKAGMHDQIDSKSWIQHHPNPKTIVRPVGTGLRRSYLPGGRFGILWRLEAPEGFQQVDFQSIYTSDCLLSWVTSHHHRWCLFPPVSAFCPSPVSQSDKQPPLWSLFRLVPYNEQDTGSTDLGTRQLAIWGPLTRQSHLARAAVGHWTAGGGQQPCPAPCPGAQRATPRLTAHSTS